MAAVLVVAAGAAVAAETGSVGSPLTPALRAMGEGRFQDALDILNRLVAGGYRPSELFDLRAQIDLAMGNDDDAERDWRRAASLDPVGSGPRLALGRLYTRRALWPEAIAVYREVLLYQPRNVEAILGLVNALQRNGRSVSARNLLETAAAAVGDTRIQERWAQVAAELGRPEEAVRALNQVAARLDGLPKRDVLKRLAGLYTKAGRTTEAYYVLQEALRIEASARGVAAATYDLAMQPADRLAQQALSAVGRALQVLDEGTAPREEVFADAEAARAQLAELGRFVSEVNPPGERRVVHAARTYAYSLANEAAVNALSYVDLGVNDRREAFVTARDAARTEMSRLAKATSGGD